MRICRRKFPHLTAISDSLPVSASITVTVNFKGVWETLVIPWSALIMVSDQKSTINIDLRKCF